jgi:hypothetical protein
MKKRMYISISLLTLVVLSTQCQKTMSEPGRGNMQAQPPNRSTDRDPLELPVDSKVSGEHMKAFLVAYEAFKTEPLIPEEKRRVENYGIEFRQQGDVYFVLFLAKRKPSERELDGGESELGKDVMYIIKKQDYTIAARQFYK